ncbi:MAG: cupin domain-containing protein [Alistipes finegoldii]
MKKVEKTAGGANFAAVTVGKMDELNQHTLILAPGVEIPESICGQRPRATRAELSFQRIEPGARRVPPHPQDARGAHIIIRGDGEFQAGRQNLAVGEGSVIRLPTADARCATPARSR